MIQQQYTKENLFWTSFLLKSRSYGKHDHTKALKKGVFSLIREHYEKELLDMLIFRSFSFSFSFSSIPNSNTKNTLPKNFQVKTTSFSSIFMT